MTSKLGKELQKYALNGVQVTGKEVGHSYFNVVVELEYKGLKCAGKRLHKEWYDMYIHDVGFASMFEKGCHLLSRVRHPNIVNFLGMFFEPNVPVPMLVIELLATDLCKCINECGVLPLEISCSIFHDASLGLNYLHTQNPPIIIHKELTTRNILLSSDMTAKIGSLYTAKLENMTVPGKLSFMPPEMFADDTQYGKSINVFSFGVVMIHVLSGIWPVPNAPQVKNPDGKLTVLSEAERRSKYLSAIGDDHPLMDLIRKCISNDPEQRVIAEEIVQYLKRALVEFPPSFANKVDMLKHIIGLKTKLGEEVEKATDSQTQTESIQLATIGTWRGIEVCAETTLIITKSSQDFYWEGYGLTLHFPEKCLPADVEECSITIIASIAGQYEFPEGSHLVSAIYWLRCEPSCKFAKAVSVEIEHCALKKNTSKLSIVRSHCTQASLPYKFKNLGGQYTDHSSYRYIEVDRFSGYAVTQDGSEERSYCAGLYYLEKIRLNPEIHCVVHWDTEAHLTHVRKKYKSEGAVTGADTAVSFEQETISLDIPQDGTIVSGGWKIVQLNQAMITKQQVDGFKLGRRIPACQLQAYQPPSVTDDQLPVLTHQVKLEGAAHPFNLLTISFMPGRSVTNSVGVNVHDKQAEPRLKLLLKELLKVADRWEDIGVFLDIDDGQLAAVKANETTVNSRLREMLRLWLRNVSPPPTWEALINAVDSLGIYETLVLELRQKYLLL